MESDKSTERLLADSCNPPYSLHSPGFGEILYGVNLQDTLPLMESRKSIRKYRGSYMKTRPLLTWTLYLCLILLWGFDTVEFKQGSLSVGFKWDFRNNGFRDAGHFASITAIMWVLSTVLMFYYVKYQVQHQLESALYVTQLAIVAMIAAIWMQYRRRDIISQIDLQSIVQGVYLLVMLLFVITRMYQVNLLPVWQERSMFLTVPLLRANPEEMVSPQLLHDFSGKCKTGLHWCAYDCVGKATQYLPRFWADRFSVNYIGEVDDQNRPHGFGEWWDTHYYGEHLVGLWSSGKPVGPFNSREKGSSSGFKNLRIGYFMNRADPLDKRSCCPEFAPDGQLFYGLVSVECSVSGVFFRDYPRVTTLDGPYEWEPNNPFQERLSSFRNNSGCSQSGSSPGDKEGDMYGKAERGQAHNACQYHPMARPQDGSEIQGRKSFDSHKSWMIQRMERSPSLKRSVWTETREDTIVVSANPNRGLLVSGYENVEGTEFPSKISISLTGDVNWVDKSEHPPPAPRADWTTTGLNVDGWTPKTNYGLYEALLFVHGFNAAVTDASRIFGQFIALGNLPPYIKPIIFSWPGGSEFSYVQARLQGVESDNTLDAFEELFRFLVADGFTRVHIMAHSIGVRIVIGAIPRLEKILIGNGPKQSGKLPLKVASITLLSPDCDLEPFRADRGHRLRGLSPLVTIYGDRTDWALSIAEVANWLIDRILLGRKPGTMHTVNSLDDLVSDSDQSDCCRATHSVSSMEKIGAKIEKVLSHAFPEQTRYVFSVFGKSSQKFEFMRRRAIKIFRGWTTGFRIKSLGRVTDKVTDAETGEPLDIDVIDTSFMDANVHGLRHNYFNLNRELIEDIRDLLVTQRRAHQRKSRLEWIGGNVFAFLVAPTHVVNP